MNEPKTPENTMIDPANSDLKPQSATGADNVAQTDPLAGNAEQPKAGDTKHGDDDSTT